MIRVNLLKTDIKSGEKKMPAGAPAVEPIEEKPAKARKSNILNLIIFLGIAVIGAAAFLQKRSLDTERTLLSEAQEQKQILAPVLQKLDLVAQQKLFLESKIGLIQELRGKQSTPLKILDTLSRALPEWVWLLEATFRGTGLDIKGRALSNIQISEFMNALQKSGLFADVVINATQQVNIGNNTVQEFTLTAVFPLPAKGPAAK